MTKKKSNTKKSFGLGMGVTLAALGAYFLYGSQEGKARRAKIKGWALRMKGEVLEELENVKELTQESYHAVVDNVSKRFKAAKNVDNKELEKLKKDLKSHWKDVKKKFEKK